MVSNATDAASAPGRWRTMSDPVRSVQVSSWSMAGELNVFTSAKSTFWPFTQLVKYEKGGFYVNYDCLIERKV